MAVEATKLDAITELSQRLHGENVHPPLAMTGHHPAGARESADRVHGVVRDRRRNRRRR